MTEATKIEWADSTFNPWEGCTKIALGCDHCYAENRNARFGGGTAPNWGPGAPRRRTSADNWRGPLRWEAGHAAFAAEHGRRRRVFCASLADVFDNEVDPAWRADLFALIASTPNLDWLLLTKRIGNAEKMISDALLELARRHEAVGVASPKPWPWKHVWLGATMVNQEEFLRDLSKLVLTPAAVHFMSYEPALGPIDSDGYFLGALDWVIAGGESGPGARPAHPDWFRSLRDQCAAESVPFLFKQWGEHDLSFDRDRDDPDCGYCDREKRKPGRWINLAGGHGFNGERVHYAHRVGKKAAGRLLDGVEHNGFPRAATRHG